jgi:hypothetical protein
MEDEDINPSNYPNYSASSGISGIAGGLGKIAGGLMSTMSGIGEIGAGTTSVGRSGLDVVAKMMSVRDSTFEDLTGCFFGPTVNVSFVDIDNLYKQAEQEGVLVSVIDRCGVMPSRLRVKITMVFRNIYLVKPLVNYDLIERGYLFFERKSSTYIMEVAVHTMDGSKSLYIIPNHIFFKYNFSTLSFSQIYESIPEDTLYAIYNGSISYYGLLALGPVHEFVIRLTTNGTLRKFNMGFDGSEFVVSDTTNGLPVHIGKSSMYILLQSTGITTDSGSVRGSVRNRRSGFGKNKKNKKKRKCRKNRKSRRKKY